MPGLADAGKDKQRITLSCLRLVLAVFLLGPLAAEAQFNKCTGNDGKVVYTDGPCPAGTKGPKGAAAAAPQIVVPELNWHQQAIAHWCVERWGEVSPRGRADRIAHLYQGAQQGGEKTKERLRQAGMTLEQAVQAEIDSLANAFNTDCSYYGFKKVGAPTDQHNDQVSKILKQTLETKYPSSRQSFERARGPGGLVIQER